MEIIVQGTGRDYFTPNEVFISINFYKKGHSYEEALRDGVQNVQRFIVEILEKNNFTVDDMKTRTFVIREDQKYDEISRSYVFDGFSFNQSATLKFDFQKEKIAKIMDDLSKMEDAPNCQINFDIKDEKECRRKIISKAYNDAKLQAQAIAQAAGLTLTKCVKVDFKPFTTDYISRTSFDTKMMMSDSAARLGSTQDIINNTFTPEDIAISETLYCLWLAE